MDRFLAMPKLRKPEAGEKKDTGRFLKAFSRLGGRLHATIRPFPVLRERADSLVRLGGKGGRAQGTPILLSVPMRAGPRNGNKAGDRNFFEGYASKTERK